MSESLVTIVQGRRHGGGGEQQKDHDGAPDKHGADDEVWHRLELFGSCYHFLYCCIM